MRKFLLVAAAVSSLSLFGLSVQAKDDAKSEGKETKGVLIDNACGDKQKDEKSAKGHPKTCAMKEGCAKSGYQVVMGDKHMKFDDKGNELAKKYLAVEENSTDVIVVGMVSDDGKTIEVTEIKAADEKSEGEEDAKDAEKSEK